MGQTSDENGEAAMMPINMSHENEDEHNKLSLIYKMYYNTMIYTAFPILKDYALAEDAVSEALIKIIRNIDRISEVSSKETKGFIRIVVENTAKNIWRKNNNRKEDSDDEIENISDNSISVIDGMASLEGCNCIIKTIRSLPQKLSDVLYLSAVLGYSNSEIAGLLNITYDVAKMRLSRAKKAVRKKLEGE